MSTPKRTIEVVNQGTSKAPRVDGSASDEVSAVGPRYQIRYSGMGASTLFRSGFRALTDTNEVMFCLPGLASDPPTMTRFDKVFRFIAKGSGTSADIELPLDWIMAEDNFRVKKEIIRDGCNEVFWRFTAKVKKM